MSYFARLDEANIVKQVIVADSVEWCERAIPGVWVETFKDRSQRMNYASVGFTYDESRDAFIPPKPFNSWILVEETCIWTAPVPYPEDEQSYVWNEKTLSWDLVTS